MHESMKTMKGWPPIRGAPYVSKKKEKKVKIIIKIFLVTRNARRKEW